MAVMDCVCLERGLSNQEEASPIIKIHHVIFQTTSLSGVQCSFSSQLPSTASPAGINRTT